MNSNLPRAIGVPTHSRTSEKSLGMMEAKARWGKPKAMGGKAVKTTAKADGEQWRMANGEWRMANDTW